MANSILGRTGVPSQQPNNMLQQFQQFRNSFRGNPQQMIQQMLQSGQINETQLQQAMQMARQFQHIVK